MFLKDFLLFLFPIDTSFALPRISFAFASVGKSLIMASIGTYLCKPIFRKPAVPFFAPNFVCVQKCHAAQALNSIQHRITFMCESLLFVMPKSSNIYYETYLLLSVAGVYIELALLLLASAFPSTV